MAQSHPAIKNNVLNSVKHDMPELYTPFTA